MNYIDLEIAKSIKQDFPSRDCEKRRLKTRPPSHYPQDPPSAISPPAGIRELRESIFEETEMAQLALRERSCRFFCSIVIMKIKCDLRMNSPWGIFHVYLCLLSEDVSATSDLDECSFKLVSATERLYLPTFLGPFTSGGGPSQLDFLRSLWNKEEHIMITQCGWLLVHNTAMFSYSARYIMSKISCSDLIQDTHIFTDSCYPSQVNHDEYFTPTLCLICLMSPRN